MLDKWNPDMCSSDVFIQIIVALNYESDLDKCKTNDLYKMSIIRVAVTHPPRILYL